MHERAGATLAGLRPLCVQGQRPAVNTNLQQQSIFDAEDRLVGMSSELGRMAGWPPMPSVALLPPNGSPGSSRTVARQSLELAQLGEIDSAFDTLDMAIDQAGWMPRMFDLPDLAPLRSLPR